MGAAEKKAVRDAQVAKLRELFPDDYAMVDKAFRLAEPKIGAITEWIMSPLVEPLNGLILLISMGDTIAQLIVTGDFDERELSGDIVTIVEKTLAQSVSGLTRH